MIEESLEKRLRYFDKDENLYILMGLNYIDNKITKADIKQAKRIQSKLNHPDKNKSDVNAELKFIKVSKACEILLDDNLRKEYDDYLKQIKDKEYIYEINKKEKSKKRQEFYNDLIKRESDNLKNLNKESDLNAKKTNSFYKDIKFNKSKFFNDFKSTKKDEDEINKEYLKSFINNTSINNYNRLLSNSVYIEFYNPELTDTNTDYNSNNELNKQFFCYDIVIDEKYIYEHFKKYGQIRYVIILNSTCSKITIDNKVIINKCALIEFIESKAANNCVKQIINGYKDYRTNLMFFNMTNALNKKEIIEKELKPNFNSNDLLFYEKTIKDKAYIPNNNTKEDLPEENENNNQYINTYILDSFSKCFDVNINQYDLSSMKDIKNNYNEKIKNLKAKYSM